MKYVLIGAGPAGVRAAETLRQQDPTGEITLVSGEPGEPYARMAIPYILNGDIQESGAHQRKTAGHFDELRVKYLNNKALQVHAGPDGGTVDLDDGTVLDYDRLLVATGSSPSLPPLPGTDLPGVVTCWTLDDARTIAAKLGPGILVRFLLRRLTMAEAIARLGDRIAVRARLVAARDGLAAVDVDKPSDLADARQILARG